MEKLKQMHSPMHPGEFIVEVYLKPAGISGRELARQLELSTAAVSRLLAGTSSVSADMAVRLSEVLGRSAERYMPPRDPSFKGCMVTVIWSPDAGA